MARKRKTKSVEATPSGSTEETAKKVAEATAATASKTTISDKVQDATKKPSSKPSTAPPPSTTTYDSLLRTMDDLLPPEPGMDHLSTVRVLLVGVTLLAVGTAGFYYLPGMMDKNDAGNPLVNSFYCATMTLTT